MPRHLHSLLALLALAACAPAPAVITARPIPGAPAAAPVAPRLNPFAERSTLALQAPHFDRMANEDFQPALEEGMRLQLAEVRAIAASPAEATFENTIVALERSGETLGRAQAVFGALTQADTNDTLQRVRTAMAPRLAAHADAINLDPALFARIARLHGRRASLGLTPEQVQLVERYHRNFVRAGAQLSDTNKMRLRAINPESSRLSTSFSNKVLAAARANALVVDTRAELAGLSEGEIAAAANDAQRRGMPGKFVIALQNTTYAFVENGGMTRANGQRFRDLVMSRGSTVPADQLFREFRGRDPRIEPLLAERGLEAKTP